MEHLGPRLNILMNELRCAWRVLYILYQECIKIWECLEKLEDFLYEQQIAIRQLNEYCSRGGGEEGLMAVEDAIDPQQSSMGELDAIAKSLGAAIGIEETSVLREKLAQQELEKMQGLVQEGASITAAVSDMQQNMRYLEALGTLGEEGNIPDEAFYRSLNNSYREDLICGDTSRPTSQLGMIWEEAEETEETNGKKESESTFDSTATKENELEESTTSLQSKEEITQATLLKKDEADEDEGEVFSAADYKSYRGNTPCVSEQDLAQLSRLSSMDASTFDKLHELDKLTNQLQKDSQNLSELRSILMDSPKRQFSSEAEAKLAEEASSIDEQLRKIYAETDVDNWTYSKSPGSTGRSISRVSTDSGLTTDGDFTTRSISPRLTSASRSNLDSISSTYTPPRLGYTSANLEKSPDPVIQLPIDVGSFAKGYAENKELTDLLVESFIAVTCASPTIYNTTTEKVASPTLSAGSVHSIHSVHSVQSIRTRQDGYFGSAAKLNLDFNESHTPPSPSPNSPPPPAPPDSSDTFLMSTIDDRESEIKEAQNAILRNADIVSLEQGRLSPRTPHSPKSPRISPKHLIKPSSAIIGTTKSDSGLSSMSGWSSLDKSPSSPKSSITKMLNSYSLDHAKSLIPTTQAVRTSSPIPPLPETSESLIIQEPLYDTPEANAAATSPSYTPALNHLSALTPMKSPVVQDELNSVLTPTPDVTSSQSPKKQRLRQQILTTDATSSTWGLDYGFRQEQPAIYSVAGSNRPQMTNVYTSGSGPAGWRTTITDSCYPETIKQVANYSDSYGLLQYSDTSLSGTTKKPIRTTSFGDAKTAQDNYKSNMYRRFPTGNITDVMSYYPTSANLPRTETNESSWLNSMENQVPHDSTTSSIRSITSDGSYSQSPYAERRYPQPPAYQAHQYHTYANQHYMTMYQQYQAYNQRAASTESAQVPDGYQRQWQRDQYSQAQEGIRMTGEQAQQGEYYDASNVIVSQSGYISIAADLKDHEAEAAKMNKKIRRGSSLKSAMSSMSSWLPDLHLTKRHRSQSLPGSVRDDDLDHDIALQQKMEMRGRSRSQAARKKKKHTLVSTVSGILQKAKRRNHHSASSLSDPEQSEAEWSSGRQSGMSEDEESVMSDANQDSTFFATIKTMSRRKHSQPQVQTQQQQIQQTLEQQQLLQQQQALQQQIQQQTKELNQQQATLFNQMQQHQMQQHQMQQHQMQQQQIQQQQQPLTPSSQEWPKVTEQRKPELSDHDLTDQGDKNEDEGKSTGSGSGGSSIFPTVGEIKKSTGSSDEAPNEKTPKLPPVTLKAGASMEFAVSRALGKYRQRQSSSVSDEQGPYDETGEKKSDEGNVFTFEANFEYQEDASEKSDKSEKSSKPPELVTSISEEAPPSEGSPSTSSIRGHMPPSGSRFLPRHQQSLEIPWGGSRSGEGDEDNRSTHSYRSTSRVSSRRQSTEDSIDSEDEWYCYELRKLEELERQSQLEIDMGETLHEEPEETESCQPDEDVKERMSFVLRELRLKAKPREDEEKKDVNKDDTRVARMNGTVSKSERDRYRDEKPIPKRKTDESIETVFARVTDYHTWAHEEEAKKEEKKTVPMEEGSSGETSGPDSPVHSMDEDEEEMRAELEEQSRKSSSASAMRQNDKMFRDMDSIPHGRQAEADADGARSHPKIEIDSTSCASADMVMKDGQISPTPPGSKWKLLKALKDRKAEEKLKEEDASKEATAITQGPTPVSILIK